jgi:hypothetical protein
MEALGVVGTLISIVQISSKLVSVCYQYRASVKDARKDISRILDEVVGVRTLVERLIDLSEQTTDDAEIPSLKAASGANGTLQRCLEELQGLKAALKLNDDGSLKQSKSVALLWPLKQKEFDARLQAIARIKSTLQLALAADTTSVKAWEATCVHC